MSCEVLLGKLPTLLFIPTAKGDPHPSWSRGQTKNMCFFVCFFRCLLRTGFTETEIGLECPNLCDGAHFFVGAPDLYGG